MTHKIVGFPKWYGENKESYNRKRKERRLANPDYRAKELAGVRAWRTRQKSIAPNPDGTYSIFAAAAALNRSVPAIRKWEIKGYIPSRPHVARKYTRQNLALMQRLIDFLEEKPRVLTNYAIRMQKITEAIALDWKFYGSDN